MAAAPVGTHAADRLSQATWPPQLACRGSDRASPSQERVGQQETGESAVTEGNGEARLAHQDLDRLPDK